MYTKRDKRFETEKSYTMRYRDPALPDSNIEFETIKNVEIKDIRDQVDLSLDIQGFEMVTYNSKMSRDQYFVSERVMNVYLPELRKLLTERYGAQRVEFVRHNVSFACA